MKKFTAFCFLALCLALVPGSLMAQTAPAHKLSLKHLLASFPATAIKVISRSTDAAEYVSGKVAVAFQKIDAAADAAEAYLSNVQ